IAGAAALAVAAVAAAVAVISYESTRSHLLGEVRSELRIRAQAFLGPHDNDGDSGGAQGRQGQPPAFQVPAPPAPGGATGLFQVVEPNGRIARSEGLPVTKRVLSIARRGSGSFFFDARVGTKRTHYEIYTVWDAPDQHAVQVALPLTDDDAVLRGL